MKEQLDRIEAKLDRVIKALQEYDGLDEDFKEPEDEYAQYKVSPCVGHDAASWEEETKPKKKYYHNKKKKDGNNKKSS